MEALVPASRSAARPYWRTGPLRSLRPDQAQALVGRPRRDCGRRRARTAAEHRPGWRLRHDERAVTCGLSREGTGYSRSARNLGAQRAAGHRSHAAHFILAWIADDMATRGARAGVVLCGEVEMDREGAHPHRATPADGNLN